MKNTKEKTAGQSDGSKGGTGAGKKLTLGQKATIKRMLSEDATPTHRAALGFCIGGIAMMSSLANLRAGSIKGRSMVCVREAAREIFAGLSPVPWWARAAEVGVRALYDEAVDYSHMPKNVGSEVLLPHIVPHGVADISYSAAVIAAVVLGAVEPEDDYGDIIAERYAFLLETYEFHPAALLPFQNEFVKRLVQIEGAKA